MPPRADEPDELFHRETVELHPLLLETTPLESKCDTTTPWMPLKLETNKNQHSFATLSLLTTNTETCSSSFLSLQSSAENQQSKSRAATAATPVSIGTTHTSHLVLPTDTIAGLCLFYRVTARALHRANPGCSTSCLPVYQWLVIPSGKGGAQRTQDRDTDGFRQAFVKYHCPALTLADIKIYLARHDNNLEQTLQEAKADLLRRQEQEHFQRESRRRQKAEAVAVQTTYRHLARQQQQQDEEGNNVVAIELADHTTSRSKSCCAAVHAQPSKFICQNLGFQLWFPKFQPSDFMH